MTEPASASFAAPPWRKTEGGEIRRLGLELEMAGIGPEDMAAAVTAEIGGTVERKSAFHTRIHDTELGDFEIELDADLLKNRGYQKALAEVGIDLGKGQARDTLESALSQVAGLVVPLELVGPPVPYTELDRLDQLRLRLHQAGARGTHASTFYAFGMQLNVEAASLQGDHLLAMLRAFLLRYDWLLERCQVDLSRRISPYVQAYPAKYCEHILDPDYAPGRDQLIDDFLAMTPTRNRPLDMLPLFAHIDKDKVMAAPVETDLIKPRPAFHYRLPNCQIDEADWSLATAWNDWIAVERLAADSQALRKALEQRRKPGGLLSKPLRWLGRRFGG